MLGSFCKAMSGVVNWLSINLCWMQGYFANLCLDCQFLKLQNISQKSTSQLILGLAKNFKVLLGFYLFWDFKPMHFLAPDVSIATVTFFCKLMANQSNSTPIQGQRYKVLPQLASNNTTQQFYDTLWTLLKSDFQTSSGNGLFERFYLLILLSLSTSLIGSFSAILLTSFWRALRNWSLISLNARQMDLILSKYHGNRNDR